MSVLKIILITILVIACLLLLIWIIGAYLMAKHLERSTGSAKDCVANSPYNPQNYGVDTDKLQEKWRAEGK